MPTTEYASMRMTELLKINHLASELEQLNRLRSEFCAHRADIAKGGVGSHVALTLSGRSVLTTTIPRDGAIQIIDILTNKIDESITEVTAELTALGLEV